MKLIKFVKENKVILFSLLVVVLALVFFAIPGQFVHYELVKGKAYTYNLSGYNFIFGLEEGNLPNKPVAEGITIFAMLILTIAGLVFSKKSSFVSLLTALALITVSVLFFTISVAGSKVYTSWIKGDYSYGWMAYLLGALTVIAGGLMMYKTVLAMKDEIKRPAKPKGPTYNYLHK